MLICDLLKLGMQIAAITFVHIHEFSSCFLKSRAVFYMLVGPVRFGSGCGPVKGKKQVRIAWKNDVFVDIK